MEYFKHLARYVMSDQSHKKLTNSSTHVIVVIVVILVRVRLFRGLAILNKERILQAPTRSPQRPSGACRGALPGALLAEAAGLPLVQRGGGARVHLAHLVPLVVVLGAAQVGPAPLNQAHNQRSAQARPRARL